MKVPKLYFATQSNFFRDLFSLPGGNEPTEGTCDKNPIKVDGVTKVDFKRLLKAMYPKFVGHLLEPYALLNVSYCSLVRNTIKFYSTMDHTEWTSALKLSTMWGFNEIRNEAIANISKSEIGAVEQALLGTEYHVPGWIIIGYRKLILREEKLSRAEAAALGYETAWLLTEIRESTFAKGVEVSTSTGREPHLFNQGWPGDDDFSSSGQGHRCGTIWQGRQLDTIDADIRSTFSSQLKDAENDDDGGGGA